MIKFGGNTIQTEETIITTITPVVKIETYNAGLNPSKGYTLEGIFETSDGNIDNPNGEVLPNNYYSLSLRSGEAEKVGTEINKLRTLLSEIANMRHFEITDSLDEEGTDTIIRNARNFHNAMISDLKQIGFICENLKITEDFRCYLDYSDHVKLAENDQEIKDYFLNKPY